MPLRRKNRTARVAPGRSERNARRPGGRGVAVAASLCEYRRGGRLCFGRNVLHVRVGGGQQRSSSTASLFA